MSQWNSSSPCVRCGLACPKGAHLSSYAPDLALHLQRQSRDGVCGICQRRCRICHAVDHDLGLFQFSDTRHGAGGFDFADPVFQSQPILSSWDWSCHRGIENLLAHFAGHRDLYPDFGSVFLADPAGIVSMAVRRADHILCVGPIVGAQSGLAVQTSGAGGMGAGSISSTVLGLQSGISSVSVPRRAIGGAVSRDPLGYDKYQWVDGPIVAVRVCSHYVFYHFVTHDWPTVRHIFRLGYLCLPLGAIFRPNRR